MEDTKTKQIKGIRIRTVSYGMVFISAVLFVLLIIATVNASREYSAMKTSTEDYIACQKQAAQIADGSNYLTEQIQLYVTTMEPQYAEAYFKEAYDTRRREKALEELKQYHVDDKVCIFLESALSHSNELMEREIYAIKLIARSQDYDISDSLKRGQNPSFSAEDRRLSSEELIAKARGIIFNTSYQEAKRQINSDISYFVNNAVDVTRKGQQNSLDTLKRTMSWQKIYISILFVLNLVTFLMVILLIVKPLQLYINCIKEEKQLEIIGAYEFKYLALTYNDIYEVKASHEAILRHKAEHDALTGLMNRGAFDQMKRFFRINPCPLALLIIDVDKFKSVNDGFGHEVGDAVLKKTAAIIKESFRANDYPARIGGDEFAVIVTEITEDMKSIILRKANAMNESLKHPDDGLPPVSLSIGCAFSSQGFSEDLYAKADQALYEVKENGRCGCHIYEDIEHEGNIESV